MNIKKLFSKIQAAANIIAKNSIYGSGGYIVVGSHTAEAIRIYEEKIKEIDIWI